MKRFYCFFSALFLLSIVTSFSALAESLDLNDFLIKLKNNHPFIKAELINSEIQKAEQESELGSQDWTLNAGASYIRRDSPEISIFAPDTTTNFNLNFDLTKEIWQSGGVFNIGYYDEYENARPRSSLDGLSSSDFSPEEFYEKGIFATYKQPLLKNRGGNLSRLPYELKEKESKISKIQSLENIEDFLYSSGVLFIEWSQLKAKKKILDKRVELSNKQLSQTRRMTKSGFKEKEDLYRVEGSYWSVKQNQALMEANADALEEEIKGLLKLSDDEKLRSKLKFKSLNIDSSKFNTLASLEELRDLQIIDILQEKKKHEIKGVQEEGKDNLDLELLAGIANGDDEYDYDLSFDRPEARVSLNYSRVLGKRSNKALISARNEQVKQLTEQYDSQKVTLKSKLKSLKRRIKLLESVYSANKKQLQSAKLRTKSEQKAYEQGRGELNFVIESRDSEQAASFQLIETAALFYTLKLEYDELNDLLLENSFS